VKRGKKKLLSHGWGGKSQAFKHRRAKEKTHPRGWGERGRGVVQVGTTRIKIRTSSAVPMKGYDPAPNPRTALEEQTVRRKLFIIQMRNPST